MVICEWNEDRSSMLVREEMQGKEQAVALKMGNVLTAWNWDTCKVNKV